MFGAYTQFDFNKKRTIDDLSHEELLAYNQTKEALNLISTKFNQGSSSLNALTLAANEFEKGKKQISHIGEFTKTTNKIFKNKQ